MSIDNDVKQADTITTVIGQEGIVIEVPVIKAQPAYLGEVPLSDYATTIFIPKGATLHKRPKSGFVKFFSGAKPTCKDAKRWYAIPMEDGQRATRLTYGNFRRGKDPGEPFYMYGGDDR